jgi:hypothetical protein
MATREDRDRKAATARAQSLRRYTTGDQYDCVVGADATGNLVVVWSSLDQDGSSAGVFGERYAPIVPVELMQFGSNSLSLGLGWESSYFTRRTAVGLMVGPPSSPPAGFVPAPSAGSLAIGGRS